MPLQVSAFKSVNKRKLVIYLFSFFMYWLINNLVSNLVFFFYDQGLHLNFYGLHMVPCETPILAYLAIFMGFKVAVFLVYLLLVRRYPKALFLEFFVAYFIYDLVALLALGWDTILPLPLSASAALACDWQQLLDHYFNHLAVYVYSFWSLALFYTLYRQKQLSRPYLFNRLVVVPVSVVVCAIPIGLIHWLVYRT